MYRSMNTRSLMVAVSALVLSSSVKANLISDSSFESTVSQGPQLSWNSSSYGNWAVGDPFSIVNSENGVSSLNGSRMLRFGSNGGSTADIYQILDISSYATEIDAGMLTADFSAYFNATVSNNVGLRIIGWDAAPNNFNGISFTSGNAINAIYTDANVGTWQQVSDTALIQSGVRFLALGIHSGNSVPTTYADQISLTLTSSVVPVPAAVWLFASGLFGLIGVAKRKSTSM